VSALTFQYFHGGIHFPRLALWLDQHEPQAGPEKVFISHAHSDHIGQHREVILSEPTAHFLRARIGGARQEHILSFGQPATFDSGGVEWQLTLLPAGHVFGSAMSWIEAEDQSLLYTGDFKLRRGLSAEPCEPRQAGTLIMETTYGRPQYQFPPTPDVLKGVIRFCCEAIDNDETAVLLGYSLGKSQELLRGLADADLPILLHESVFKLTQIYERLGQTFPRYGKFEGRPVGGSVLICPPLPNRSAVLRKLGRVRTAVLTGWAVDPNCHFRYQTDAAFPLSDHADFNELVEFVKCVAPRNVFTLHGFAADFAQTLRELGFEARALSQEEQLALPLEASNFSFLGSGLKLAEPAAPVPSASEPTPHPSQEGNRTGAPKHSPPPSAEPAAGSDLSIPQHGFYRFAEICRAIGAVGGKLEKVRLLADYLQPLEGEPLAWVTTWLTGYPFPPSHNKTLQLGGAVIRDALCAVGRITPTSLRQIYLKHSDAGETAFEILSNQPAASLALSIECVQSLFERLHNARGPSAKLPLLIDALGRCAPMEAKFLIKILTGDLRIGLKEGLVEEAVAQAFNARVDDVKRANLLLGDIGETARLAQQRRLAMAGLVPFRPVKFMLASPAESAVAIWERTVGRAAVSPLTAAKVAEAESAAGRQDTGSTWVWLEDKYDGVRCQLHKVGVQVALYSRDLKDITDTFFDIADVARQLPGDLILDGEILAMRGERVLPFAELQKRLGRREGDLFLGGEIPVRYIAFDLLWRDGRSLLDEPLRVRRHMIEALGPLPDAFGLAHIMQARSPEAIEDGFRAARARDNEGLMIKDPESVYLPGRRGLAWLKLKKALATLDCVVVGAEYGHGKRKAVLSDYTFAVRDDETGELKTIGKAYSGLTDAEIAELTRHFLDRTIRRQGRYHEVEPDTVLEIAFDSIHLSDRHSSGLAMRFPRIVRIRADKSPAEIDTVTAARTLVKDWEKARINPTKGNIQHRTPNTQHRTRG
jgi:DNA ligase-1